MWGDPMKQFSCTLADNEKDRYRFRLKSNICTTAYILTAFWCPLDQLILSPGYSCLKIVRKRKREIVAEFLGSAYLKMGKLLPMNLYSYFRVEDHLLGKKRLDLGLEVVKRKGLCKIIVTACLQTPVTVSWRNEACHS